jgi:hypothetical protein
VVKEVARQAFDGSQVAVNLADAENAAQAGTIDLFLNSEDEPPDALSPEADLQRKLQGTHPVPASAAVSPAPVRRRHKSK